MARTSRGRGHDPRDRARAAGALRPTGPRRRDPAAPSPSELGRGSVQSHSAPAYAAIREASHGAVAQSVRSSGLIIRRSVVRVHPRPHRSGESSSSRHLTVGWCSSTSEGSSSSGSAVASMRWAGELEEAMDRPQRGQGVERPQESDTLEGVFHLEGVSTGRFGPRTARSGCSWPLRRNGSRRSIQV